MDSPTAHRWQRIMLELTERLQAAGVTVNGTVHNHCWAALHKTYDLGVMDGAKITPADLKRVVDQAANDRRPQPLNRAQRRVLERKGLI